MEVDGKTSRDFGGGMLVFLIRCFEFMSSGAGAVLAQKF